MSTRTTSLQERIEIVDRHLAGESLPKIAQSLGLHKDTARKWWRKYRKLGWAGINSTYGRKPRGALSQYDPLCKFVALRLKLEHPAWGLDLLRLHMSRRPSLAGKSLPGRTALHNYLKPYYSRFRPQPRYPTNRPEQKDPRATFAHQCWQMDFKGRERIKGLGWVMSLNICDAFSSAPLAGKIFSHKDKNPLSKVNWQVIQAQLRECFVTWGKPLYLKMDRDPLFVGSTRFEWPGSLLLWLIGLGIKPIVNRAATPTDNANVERINLTWLNHVGITTLSYKSETQLQVEANQAWEDRRRYLPSRNRNCNNKPPLTAIPELVHSKRDYDPKTEAQSFHIQKVHQYLEKWQWKRQVDTHGRISLGGFQKSISKQHSGHMVKVKFISQKKAFEVFDMDGNSLRVFSLPIISTQHLTQVGGAT